MELIRIDEGKLKIILTHEDLAEFEIDESELDYANTETKRMFWELLRRAKHATGFDTDGHRVLVQIFPSKSGGCEMFITRLGELCSELSDDGESEGNIISRLDCPEDINEHLSEKRGYMGAYAFESLDALIRACRRLYTVGYSGASDAYIGEDGRAYLFLSEMEVCPYLPLNEYSFLSEYGSSENAEATRLYVEEHASAVRRSDAVQLLSSF